MEPGIDSIGRCCWCRGYVAGGGQGLSWKDIPPGLAPLCGCMVPFVFEVSVSVCQPTSVTCGLSRFLSPKTSMRPCLSLDRSLGWSCPTPPVMPAGG
eukprot:6474815-Amphidinium_carterae.1